VRNIRASIRSNLHGMINAAAQSWNQWSAHLRRFLNALEIYVSAVERQSVARFCCHRPSRTDAALETEKLGRARGFTSLLHPEDSIYARISSPLAQCGPCGWHSHILRGTAIAWARVRVQRRTDLLFPRAERGGCLHGRCTVLPVERIDGVHHLRWPTAPGVRTG
jgi:hypothetical protein